MLKIIAMLNFRKILKLAKTPENFILFKFFGFSLFVFLLNPIATWVMNYESILALLFILLIHAVYCFRIILSFPVHLKMLIIVVLLMVNYNAVQFIALIIYMYISKANFAP